MKVIALILIFLPCLLFADVYSNTVVFPLVLERQSIDESKPTEIARLDEASMRFNLEMEVCRLTIDKNTFNCEVFCRYEECGTGLSPALNMSISREDFFNIVMNAMKWSKPQYRETFEALLKNKIDSIYRMALLPAIWDQEGWNSKAPKNVHYGLPQELSLFSSEGGNVAFRLHTPH